MTNIKNKKRVRDLGALILLSALASALLTCEKVPDYCGKGTGKASWLKDGQFCFGDKAYNLCNGKDYNPLTNGCAPITGDVGTRCLNDSIVPSGTPCGGYTLATAAIPDGGGKVTRAPDKPTYNAGNQPILAAAPEPGYAFVAWAGAMASRDPVATYTMAGGNPLVSIAAIFKPTAAGNPILFAEAFPKEGGEVTRSPDKETYDAGETVRVTAAATPGYAFVGWAGADTSKNIAVTVAMNESKTLVAVFKPVTYKISVAAIPADGGAVFVNGAALPEGEQRDVGAEVEATAKAADGYAFVNWTVTAGGAATANPITVKMSGNITITANFKWVGITPPSVGDSRLVGDWRFVFAKGDTTRYGRGYDNFDVMSLKSSADLALAFYGRAPGDVWIEENLGVVGRWIADGSTLYATLPDGSVSDIPYSVSGDTLTLTDGLCHEEYNGDRGEYEMYCFDAIYIRTSLAEVRKSLGTVYTADTALQGEWVLQGGDNETMYFRSPSFYGGSRYGVGDDYDYRNYWHTSGSKLYLVFVDCYGDDLYVDGYLDDRKCTIKETKTFNYSVTGSGDNRTLKINGDTWKINIREYNAPAKSRQGKRERKYFWR
jgi:uncharacterized repeat protein (TIGR02543 family)